MTPSVKKLLAKHLDKSTCHDILTLFAEYDIDLSVGRNNVFAANVLEFTRYEYLEIEKFLNAQKHDPSGQAEKFRVFQDWMVLVNHYDKQPEDYYKSFAKALLSAANSISASGFSFGTSMNTLCIQYINEGDFNPVAFVIPLVDGSIFLTYHPGANGMHKLPSIVEEIPGLVVSVNEFSREINPFLSGVTKRANK